MKKIIALTIALSAAAGANAAWQNGYNNDTANGNGELLFFMFDENSANQISGAQDLGVKWDDVVTQKTNTGYSLSFALDSTVFNNFNGIDTTAVRWGVLAGTWGSNDNPKGVMVTALADTDFTTNLSNTAFGGATKSNLSKFTPDVNGVGTPTAAQYLENNATYAAVGSADYLGANNNLGRSWAQALPFDTTGGIDDVLTFNLMVKPNVGAQQISQFVGLWDLDLATKTLTYSYTAPTPEVPVPAAAWLMGSALVGLAGVARRRNH
jgi:hypothetical protein